MVHLPRYYETSQKWYILISMTSVVEIWEQGSTGSKFLDFCSKISNFSVTALNDFQNGSSKIRHHLRKQSVPKMKLSTNFNTKTLVSYSRLRNKHKGTLINFWGFFQGLRSLLERVILFFFFKISAIWWYWGCLL